MRSMLENRVVKMEAVLTPPVSPLKALLIENAGFESLVMGYGVDFEVIKRLPGACDGLPRELLKVLVEKLLALSKEPLRQ